MDESTSDAGLGEAGAIVPSSPPASIPTAGPSAAVPRARHPAKRTCLLTRVRVEHLRGYEDTELHFNGLSVVVGGNNQGKSSILRMVDWVFNKADAEVLSGKRRLHDDEAALLLPANRGDHRGRRLRLYFHFDDARTARPFAGNQGEVQLRISVGKTLLRLRLNLGDPARSEAHDPNALEMLELARTSIQFLLIPAARDARSDRFRDGLESRLHQLFLQHFDHQRRGGAPSAYREAKGIVESLAKMVSGVSDGIQEELASVVPPDMLRSAALVLDASPQKLASWLKDNTALALSTGTHDEDRVNPIEVGNGLQSALDVAFSIASIAPDTRQVVLAVEEPEAFLHPSAQRVVAARLRGLTDDGHTNGCRRDILVTTHSPYFVDEALFGEIVLARRHTFFHPNIPEDSVREEINTALMTVGSAELFFSRGILLVEGPGDRDLFWTLLRRFQLAFRNTRWAVALSELAVFDVGGKRRFVPWWKLLSAYPTYPRSAFQWLSLFDGDAAAKDDAGQRALLEATDKAGIPFLAPTRAAITEFGDLPYDDPDERRRVVVELNKRIRNIHLFSVDCDWAAFGRYSATDVALVERILEVGAGAKLGAQALARRAGSKVGKGKDASSPKKHPYRRRQLANGMSLASIPEEIGEVLRRWFGLVMPQEDVANLWKDVASLKP
jgi:hypothetical protein